MIVCDTGVLVGSVDADDAHHEECAAVFAAHGDELVVPASVLIESCWLLNRYVSPDQEVAVLHAVADGDLVVASLEQADYRRAAELLTTYRDLRLGVVDATVMALAERLGATTIATIDRRDFTVIRPVHVAAFTLVP